MATKAKDPIQDLRGKIARKDELIAKWTAAEKECTRINAAGDASRKYFRNMARSERNKKADLEEKLLKSDG